MSLLQNANLDDNDNINEEQLTTQEYSSNGAKWPWVHMGKNNQFSGAIPPIKINDQEFVVCRKHALYKYNVFNEQLEEWIKYDNEMELFSFGCAQHSNKLIYIYHLYHLWKINYDTKHVDIIRLYSPFPPAGNSGILTIINDKLHLIGGTNSKKHFIFDDKTNAFSVNHIFEKQNRNITGIYGMGVIHISEKQILMFGGSDDSGVLDDIYSYCSDANKWTKLNSTLPIKLCHPVLDTTNDKKYVIICGGITKNYTYSKEIFVMDLESMQFMSTYIKCPEKISGGFGMIMNNKLRETVLVCGYVRGNYIKHYPDNLVKLIQLWCSIEEFHWVEVYSTPGSYYKICVNHIMNSIQYK